MPDVPDAASGWSVERINTAPISTQQNTDAVVALANLITEWGAYRRPE